MASFITSSDLAFGDMTINFCDPEFAGMGVYGDPQNLSNQVYRFVSYALFANRLIVPSRYLLSEGITFETFRALQGLLEAGVLVPDLREGYSRFVDYLADNGVTDEGRLVCAQFLDDHSDSVYSFDVSGQSGLYHERLLGDIAPDGVLRNKLDPNGANSDGFDRLLDRFADCEGGRRTFVRVATEELGGYEDELSRWAALRYYTTPAELEPRCLRDFPFAISRELRDCGLSRPCGFVDPDEHGVMPEPMNLAHQVLISLPSQMSFDDLSKLSAVTLRVREQVPNGAAKFSTLCEQGFANNLYQINQLFAEELARERGFSSRTHGFARDALLGDTISSIVWWVLGLFGAPTEFVQSIWEAFKPVAKGEIAKKRQPFMETASRLDRQVQNIHK